MYRVTIVDTTTDESSVYDHQGDWNDADEFMWNEGNYACDCNRRLFFERGGGAESNNDQPCGFGRYRVASIVSEGCEVYQELAQ